MSISLQPENFLKKVKHPVQLEVRTKKLFREFKAVHIKTGRLAIVVAVNILDEDSEEHGMYVKVGNFKREIISEYEFYLEEQIYHPAWKGVDFDGTLATHSVDTMRDIYDIGEPIWSMIDRVKEWIKEGWTVKIFTARAYFGPSAILGVQDWLEDVAGLPRLEVTNVKDGSCIELYDDRAVQVEANTGRLLGVPGGV